MTTLTPPTILSTDEWRKYDILIVDDEPAVLDQLEEDLSFENFSLVKACSGEEALEIIDRQKIYVAICDQKMPGRMQGTDFLREARKKQPYLMGMILSAFGEPEYLFSAINDAQAFRYLLKPWDPQEIIRHLTQVLQLCHNRLLEEERQSQLLNHTHQLLTRSILESSSHREAIQETAQSLAIISDVAGQLAATLGKQLRKEFPTC